MPRTYGVSRSLIIISDGLISAGSLVFGIIHDNIDETNVFAFGIGSSVNRLLIEGIARVGQGEATIVKRESDAKEAADRFRQYVSVPVLTNVEFAIEGFEILDREPQAFADLMASRPLVLSGRWRGAPEGTLTVTGMGGAGPFEKVIDVSSVEVSADGALPYVWARQRIAALADWNFGKPTRDQKSEILALGLSYGLLTNYTSFVAVTEEIRTDGTQSDDVVQLLPLPKGVSDLALGYGTSSGDEPALVILLLLAGALLAARHFRSRFGARGET